MTDQCEFSRIPRDHTVTHAAHDAHAATIRTRTSPHTHAVSVAATTSDLSTAERTAPARDAREWMGGEAWRARAGDVSGRGGQLGPQLLPRQEAAAHLFGQLVDLSPSEAPGRCRSRGRGCSRSPRRSRFGGWRCSSSRGNSLGARTFAPQGSKSRH